MPHGEKPPPGQTLVLPLPQPMPPPMPMSPPVSMAETNIRIMPSIMRIIIEAMSSAKKNAGEREGVAARDRANAAGRSRERERR